MSLVGQTVGRYRITAQLGEGGMGVVYRAEDSTLGRDVAIKVLRPELGRHPERVRRFSQEARAASALNHPNIITVHDAGEFEGGPFLVMELVEGESLRGQLRRGALPLVKVVDIGIQAATALARAHEGGITHRDLKPENILVRPDGYVKVLDFGLAKLKEKEPAGSDSAATTLDAALTSEGSVVGTAAYMSPEQAMGRGADGRSDVFSLALVLFECWQGRHPFWRENVLDTLHAIAHDRLPALAYAPGSAEWSLARILEKALEKETDERYQTMKDLGIDLRRLKQESESGKLKVVAPATPSGASRRPLLYAVAGLVLLAIAVWAGLVLFRSRKTAGPPQSEYTQLTNFADSAVAPSLSPDGRMLAFIRGEETFVGPGEVYVKLLPDGEPVQLTHDGSSKMGPTVFSPDGARIAYSVGIRDTWTVPVLGGEPSRMLANASGLTWTEAGAGKRRILFSELTGEGIHMGIFTSTESRAEERKVYLPADVSGMAHRSYLSPDRNWVLLVEMDLGGWLPCRLVPYDGSSMGKQVGPSPAQCTDAAWSPDGKWMYFAANTGNGFHIWRQRFSGAGPVSAPEQVTSGATEEQGIAFAADGRSFVSSVGASQSTLWVHDGRGERQITSQGYAYLPSFSVDGERLYYLVRSRANRHFVSGELWVANLGTGKRERLLPDFLIEHYSVSADGSRAVFVAIDDAGRSPVWVAALDGSSAPRRLASLNSSRAFFGATGDVFFVGGEGTTWFLHRIKEDGGGLQKMGSNPVVFLFDVAPDGKALAAYVGKSVVIYPIDGGPPIELCSGCATSGAENRGVTPPQVSWSRDGKFLYLHFAHATRGTYAVPLRPGQILPPLPASGIRSPADAAALPGARAIPQQQAFAGPNPSIYAYPRVTTHRNIYRIPVP